MTSPDMASAAPTGWADDRLMQAYDLLTAVLDLHHPETDAHGILTKARDMIEEADIELEKVA